MLIGLFSWSVLPKSWRAMVGTINILRRDIDMELTAEELF